MREYLISTINESKTSINVSGYDYLLWKVGLSIFVEPTSYNSACIYGTVSDGVIFFSGHMEDLVPKLECRSINHEHFIELMLLEKTICTTTPLDGIFSTICVAVNEIDPARSEITSFTPMQGRFGACSAKRSRDSLIRDMRDILDEQLRLPHESGLGNDTGLFGGAGVDSSILLGLLKKQNRVVKLFTFGYDDQYTSIPDVSEINNSRKVADYYGTQQEIFQFTPRDIWNEIARYGRHELSASRLHYSHIERYYSSIQVSLPATTFFSGYYADTLLNPTRILSRIALDKSIAWNEPWHELLFVDFRRELTRD